MQVQRGSSGGELLIHNDVRVAATCVSTYAYSCKVPLLPIARRVKSRSLEENNDLFKPTLLIFKTTQSAIEFRSAQKFCIKIHYCRAIIRIALPRQRPDVVVHPHANFSLQSVHKTQRAHCSA